MGIIDETTKENLQTNNPKIASFYLLPKIHKRNTPGRPTVNSIGAVTEKISSFVDEHLRRFIPRIPSYVKDTTHFINITKNIQLDPDDLLVIADVTSLYTNIEQKQGTAMGTRMAPNYAIIFMHYLETHFLTSYPNNQKFGYDS